MRQYDVEHFFSFEEKRFLIQSHNSYAKTQIRFLGKSNSMDLEKMMLVARCHPTTKPLSTTDITVAASVLNDKTTRSVNVSLHILNDWLFLLEPARPGCFCTIYMPDPSSH